MSICFRKNILREHRIDLILTLNVHRYSKKSYIFRDVWNSIIGLETKEWLDGIIKWMLNSSCGQVATEKCTLLLIPSIYNRMYSVDLLIGMIDESFNTLYS